MSWDLALICQHPDHRTDGSAPVVWTHVVPVPFFAAPIRVAAGQSVDFLPPLPETTVDGCPLSWADWNVTYNLSGMLRLAGNDLGIPTANTRQGAGWTFDDLHGLNGPTGASIMHRIAEHIDGNPAKFDELNPANGWGNREGLVDTLRAMVKAVPEWPTEWSVS